MKALVYSDWSKVEVKDVPMPEPKGSEALIKVEACGICGSELETFKHKSERRRPPLILGHEFAGKIEFVKENTLDLRKGQSVIVNSVVSCGECWYCKKGMANLCPKRQVFGMHRPGAIAEYVAVPADFVYPRPANVTAVQGALAEPLANAVHMFERLPKEPVSTVGVLGAGPIGLMMLQAAKIYTGCRAIVADFNLNRLLIAKEIGAEMIVDVSKEDFVAQSMAFSGGRGLDLCIDAVGTGITKAQSLKSVAAGGTVVWFGLLENKVAIESYELTLNEKRIFGSYSATKKDFEKALQLFAQGAIQSKPWVGEFPIDDAEKAFHRMLKAEENDVKAVILPEQQNGRTI
jgi:L-iditol 2-dehydrogenase